MSTETLLEKLAPLERPFPALHALLTRVVHERAVTSFNELDGVLGLPSYVLLQLAVSRQGLSTRALALLAGRLGIPAHELLYMLEPDAYGHPARREESGVTSR